MGDSAIFTLSSDYDSAGDQQQAIDKLVEQIAVSYTHLTLPTIYSV